MAGRLWLIQDPSLGNTGMWPLIGGLLGFAAILALSYMGLRMMSRRNLLSARGRHMQVVDRMVVGRDSMILLIRVAGKALVAGVSKEGMRTLCELDPQELEAEQEERSAMRPESESPREKGFVGRFLHNLGVFSGVKDAPPQRPGQGAGVAAASFKDALLHTGEEMAGEPEVPLPSETEPAQTRADDAPDMPDPTDYNAAIERMRAYSRMKIEPQARAEPTAMDNLAFIQAARNYAAQQKSMSQAEETPAAEAVAPIAPESSPEPVRPESSWPDAIESISDRVRERIQRLSRKLE